MRCILVPQTTKMGTCEAGESSSISVFGYDPSRSGCPAIFDCSSKELNKVCTGQMRCIWRHYGRNVRVSLPDSYKD